jgi:hypothetical protein
MKLEEVEEATEEAFPRNGRPKCILERKRVVDQISDSLDIRNSVYLRGAFGSGKTQLLKAIGRRLLQTNEWVVYYLKAIKLLDKLTEENLNAALDFQAKTSRKKLCVIIDEARGNMDSPILYFLCKENKPFAVLAAAVPILPRSISNLFPVQIAFADLLLDIKKDKEDIYQLATFWNKERHSNRSHYSHADVFEICRFLCSFTNGHMYPLVASSTYAFSTAKIEYCRSVDEFKRHYLSAQFVLCSDYVKITNRCFTEVKYFYQELLDCLRNKRPAKLPELLHNGLIVMNTTTTPKTLQILSPYLESMVLNSSDIQTDETKRSDQVSLKKGRKNDDKQHQLNLEVIIRSGLELMVPADFDEGSQFSKVSYKAENGIGFSWCIRAKQKVTNLYVAAQARGVSGLVDFIVDGIVGGAIELVVNGNKMDEHSRRFSDRKYPWRYNAILNIQLRGNKVILPSSQCNYDHEKVYTYILETNTLFKGKQSLVVGVASAMVTPPSTTSPAVEESSNSAESSSKKGRKRKTTNEESEGNYYSVCQFIFLSLFLTDPLNEEDLQRDLDSCVDLTKGK